jgi:hypothetical protein
MKRLSGAAMVSTSSARSARVESPMRMYTQAISNSATSNHFEVRGTLW